MAVVAKVYSSSISLGYLLLSPINEKHVSGIAAGIRLVLLMPAIAPQAQQICGVPLGPLGKAPSLRIQQRAVDILRPVLPYAFVAKPPKIAAVPGH
jgi:hypothetical protein